MGRYAQADEPVKSSMENPGFDYTVQWLAEAEFRRHRMPVEQRVAALLDEAISTYWDAQPERFSSLEQVREAMAAFRVMVDDAIDATVQLVVE